MSETSALALTLLLACWTPLATCGGGRHASVKSKYAGQLITSSTLRWQHFTASKLSEASSVPETAVQWGSSTAPSWICRAQHHGAVLAGATAFDVKASGHTCAVGFVNKVHRKHKYDLLLNTAGAAKLDWRPYSVFSTVPVGAVAAADAGDAASHAFVGRSAGSHGYSAGSIAVHAATYSFKHLSSLDLSSNAVSRVDAGEVLVEVEPERYILELGEFSPRALKPKVTRKDVVLAKSSLFRFAEGRDRLARLQKVLAYEYSRSEYFGRAPGAILAVPTDVRLPSGRMRSVRWGLIDDIKQKETIMVGKMLSHQSAVDVSVVGVRVTEETHYVGNLTAVFPGGDRRTR